MVVRLLLLCVALALELSSAVFWRALDPQLMEELLALAACVLVALAMFSRCCCCCAPALSPLAGQWSLLIALLIVLSFASALSVPRALVASAALFVPAVTAPLSALLDSRHAPVTVVLALATSAAAMAGTGAHAELLAALDEHGSALALACSCAAAVAVQWAGVQRVLHARAPGARLRVGSGALVLAVLVRAAALLVLAVAVLFALSTLSDEARVRRASAELLVRSPRPDAALADIGGKLLRGHEHETPPALGRAATTPAPTAPAAGRMADDHAHGAGDDGASPPAYEAVVRSASASGGGGGGRGGGGEDMRAGAPARWLSEPAASSGDGALSGDAEADHGVEAVLTHTCTRCGFATHGLTAMHQHALHCSLGGGARARAGGGGEEAEVMPMRLGMY
ncbi:hypothetical protein KFE25_012188 [Diacronema lutheri]|uniref:C2H2-type domain-containing protein n=2 Tax=Diacronema lutheri TaxID=2081491 RepID=A0A8J6CCC7_DIALT|nr:hypothetical protein KFE25_012188 [Diacronema lutheri]